MNIIEQIAAFGRQDKHTVRYSGGYNHRDGPITPAMLKTHLDGGQSLGMILNDDDGMSRCLVLDFDDHDKKGDDFALGPTLTVATHLERFGIPFLVFRSGGGYGYHIWMFFEKAYSKDQMWAFAKEIFDNIDDFEDVYKVVSSGDLHRSKTDARGKIIRKEHGVEVFPKSDANSNIAVPCGRESVPMHIVAEKGVQWLEECSVDDLAIEFVPVKTRVSEEVEKGGEDRDAAFACFIKAYDPDNRDQWAAAGLALVAAFGKKCDWARAKWIEWSRTSAKYQPGDEDEWSKYKVRKFSKLSFWRIAKRHGYNGPWPGKPQVSKDDIEKFGAQWALLAHEAKIEFMDTTTGEVRDASGFHLLTMPDERVREEWKRSPSRRMFTGFTYAPPNYDGDKWNLYRGRKVEPEGGDASMFEKYVVEVLCAGDVDLAHWIMSFVADGVQEPWSTRPGTGLAIRGPQGSGKSFLGYCINAVLGDNMALEVTESDRIMQKHNEIVRNKTFLLCDEAIFTGSHKQADLLKNLITARSWTFEPKHRAAYTVPHITRIIATTNKTHAVAIDNDDRRWTVHNSTPVCPHQPASREAMQWWAPYYAVPQQRPGALLQYLLDYKVDHELISIPHHTQAKAEDKLASDPILQVLAHCCEVGTLPDDVNGTGRVSTRALTREVNARVTHGRMAAQTVTAEVRARFGARSHPKCSVITSQTVRHEQGGEPYIVPRTRHDYDGLEMPPLDELRARVSSVTGLPHDGPEVWDCYRLDTPDTSAGEASDEDVMTFGMMQYKIERLQRELARVTAERDRLDTPF